MPRAIGHCPELGSSVRACGGSAGQLKSNVRRPPATIDAQPLPHCLGCANSPPPTLPIPSPLFGPPGRNKLEVESRESYFKMYKAYCTHPSPPYPVACSDESLEKVYKSQEVYGRCVASGSRCG